MRRWFLSYHSPDQALAERLKAAIEQKDSTSRVFFAPTHIRAGRSWSAQLANEIAQADAFILLIGEKGIGDWQELEYDEALDKWTSSRNKSPFPLIVVLLEGQTAPGLHFLRRMHWIVTRDPGSEKDIGRLFDAVAGRGSIPGELWRYTSPYRGLEAMEEKDSDYFFGRKRETVEVLNALAAPDRLPVLIGNSGVGKSSLAKAGALAALKRQAWPEQAAGANEWPGVFKDSRQWCFLSLKPGTDPLKALVDSFLDVWQFEAEYERVREQKGWIELLLGNGTLSDLVEATERRRAKLDQPKPPAFMLYVDQGEELYVRSGEQQRQRFSELLAQALSDTRLRTMMSLRADFLGHLQSDKPLFKARQHIDVPPLGEEELREVVSRPAHLLGAQFETAELIDTITQRAAEESVKDVGALPLLAYTLNDMWTQMMRRGDGKLRLPAQFFELGGVLVNRANNFLAERPGAEGALRRILTLKLATVREDGEPTRRRALRSEFSDDEWRLVSELADYPNRLLIAAASEGNETYAEIAHEAIFRRWDRLRAWITQEREFLGWKSELEGARRRWQAAPLASRDDALLMGLALAQAQDWLAKRAEDLPSADQDFIRESIRHDARERQQRQRMKHRARQRGALATVLILCIGAGLAWSNRAYLRAKAVTWGEVLWPKTLPAESEHTLKPGQDFKECADCPKMVVVPAGEFMMGSPENEEGRYSDERPRHKVTLARAFAVSKFEVMFDEWDACVLLGGCAWPAPEAAGWGRGTHPVIGVSWDDAQQYVAWLSRRTGKTYRLLSEAEWEYAARAGTATAYPWGDEVGGENANCEECGSQWDGKQTAPVGSFTANPFGLHDMNGNVFEWVQDCYQAYNEEPSDGSAITSGECIRRVDRGGAWNSEPKDIRSAVRFRNTPDIRYDSVGFRIARSLSP
jgi:formylglycine-generating enzyme required for sulfatase activity